MFLAGCGSDDDAKPGATITETVTVTASPEAAPAPDGDSDTDSEPGGAGGVWVQTYESPTEIVDIIDAEVVPCAPNEGDEPSVTGFSDLALTCWYDRPDGARDQMSASTYATEQQQAQALEYLLAPDGGPRPGATYVSGPGFTVATEAETAPALAEALDAFVLN